MEKYHRKYCVHKATCDHKEYYLPTCIPTYQSEKSQPAACCDFTGFRQLVCCDAGFRNFRAISVEGQQTVLVLLNLKYSVKFEETSLGRKTSNVQFN